MIGNRTMQKLSVAAALVACLLSSCTEKNNSAAPKTSTKSTTSPDKPQPIAEAKEPAFTDEFDDAIDGIAQDADPLGEYDENVSQLSVRDPRISDSQAERNKYLSVRGEPVVLQPTTTVTLPPLLPSPAEVAATKLTPTSLVRPVDNDAKAAAPDTTPLVRITVPPTPTSSTSTGVPRTVPDLGLSTAAADALVAKIQWPSPIEVKTTESPSSDANAFAATFAIDPTIKRSLKSASTRIGVITGQGFVKLFVAGIAVIDPSVLGPSGTDELMNVMRTLGNAETTTFQGLPAAVVNTEQGLREYVVIVNDRLLAVGGASNDDQKLRELLGAVIAAAK